MDPGESFPAEIPHPSPSPPGHSTGGKLGVASGDHLLSLHFSGKYFIVLFPRATVDIGDEVFRQDKKGGAAEGTPFGEVTEAALRICHGQDGIDDRRF
jgi:hypothetical protein